MNRFSPGPAPTDSTPQAVAPGWQAAFSVDENIEGMEHRTVDGNVHEQAPAFRPGWQQAFSQDEIIEGMEHRAIDGNVHEQAHAFRPGWQQAFSQDEIIEGMEHRSLDGTLPLPGVPDNEIPVRGTGQPARKSGGTSQGPFVPGWKSVVPERQYDATLPGEGENKTSVHIHSEHHAGLFAAGVSDG